MKKFKLLLLLGLLATTLTGCGEETASDGGTKHFVGENWKCLCTHDANDANITSLQYYRDTDTDIIYLYFDSYYRASISVYYNKDGAPMTYKEFEKVHMNKYHKD